MPEVERFVTRVRPQSAGIEVTFPEAIEATGVPLIIKEQLVAYSHLFGGAEVRVYGYGPSFYGGGGSPPNYSIKILGYHYETVRELAEDLGRRLTSFARIHEVDTNASGAWFESDRAGELVLALDRPRLALYELSASDVVAQVQAAIGGAEGRSRVMRLGGDQVRYAVRLAGHGRLDLLALENLLVPSPGGAAVRLGEVAALSERQVPSRILRENQQYQRTVAYEFRGPARLGDRVRDAVVEVTHLPAGYSLETTREWSWAQEEQQQVYGVLLLALAPILMVTAALFESLRQPFCVLLTVPMALVGVFLIFYLTGASFTREAYIGVIMMAGIVVNNAIPLIDHVNRLRRETRPPARRGDPAGHLRARPPDPDDQRDDDLRAAAAGALQRGRGRQHLERARLRADRRAGQLDPVRAHGDASTLPALRAAERAAAGGTAHGTTPVAGDRNHPRHALLSGEVMNSSPSLPLLSTPLPLYLAARGAAGVSCEALVGVDTLASGAVLGSTWPEGFRLTQRPIVHGAPLYAVPRNELEVPYVVHFRIGGLTRASHSLCGRGRF